mgnify:CR=1 FL=1
MDAFAQAALVGAATRYSLDPTLIAALVLIESGGDTYAWNPEPKYRYFWNVKRNEPFRPVTWSEVNSKTPPPDFPTLAGDRDQEWWAQQASWGLMQVMGAVAREKGFTGPYLTALLEPTRGLEFGCRVLAGLMAWSKGNVEQALAAFNGGKGGNAAPPYRNAAYAAKVLRVQRQSE